MVRRLGPVHDLSKISRQASEGRVLVTKRVTVWLANHDYDVSTQVVEILKSLDRCGEYLGSCDLANGERADEYLVSTGGVEWYVKLYVDSTTDTVAVWSCWWQGTAH